MRKGYALLRGDEGDLGAQCADLTAAGCAEVSIERDCGPSAADRLAGQLRRLSKGDDLVVQRLELLAERTTSLAELAAAAATAGVGIAILEPTPLRIAAWEIEQPGMETAGQARPGPDMLRQSQALAAMTALSQPYRLVLFRAILAAGERGVSRRELTGRLKMAGSALTFHLRTLAEAQLIEAQRGADGQICVARRTHLTGLLAWLGGEDARRAERA